MDKIGKENLERFREMASRWDESPTRVALSAAIFSAVKQRALLRPGMRALEIGAGTGLLTLPVAAEVASVDAFDLSEEMLDVLSEKIRTEKIGNIRIHAADFPDPSVAGERFDLVYSAMTLHHIADVPALLRQVGSFLFPSGSLAVADLVKEDGTFHADNKGVAHFGFDTRALAEEVAAAGLTVREVEPVHVIEKTIGPGDVRAYPVFLLLAGR